MQAKTKTLWTFAITSVALFMVVLDNLVVSTALPVIRTDLDATIEQLEWTVNAYTLTFAVFLLTGAALGDRLGRRRVFAAGLAVFTLGSIGAALAAPILFWFFSYPMPLVALTVFVAAMIVIRHRANIKRLLNGAEPRFGARPSSR